MRQPQAPEVRWAWGGERGTLVHIQRGELEDICTTIQFILDTGPQPSQFKRIRELIERIKPWVNEEQLRDLHIYRSSM